MRFINRVKETLHWGSNNKTASLCSQCIHWRHSLGCFMRPVEMLSGAWCLAPIHQVRGGGERARTTVQEGDWKIHEVRGSQRSSVGLVAAEGRAKEKAVSDQGFMA